MTKGMKYGLFILKKDSDIITLLETENYDEAFDLWKETKDRWAVCIKEQLPFELTKPIVTVFDPGLIYEITVRPVPNVGNAATSTNNPYTEKMYKDGFANTLRSQGAILDSGFK